MNENVRKEFERLKSLTTPQTKDKEMIFSLYKTYVNSNAQFYVENCGCQNAIENIYKELMNWYNGQTRLD